MCCLCKIFRRGCRINRHCDDFIDDPCDERDDPRDEHLCDCKQFECGHVAFPDFICPKRRRRDRDDED